MSGACRPGARITQVLPVNNGLKSARDFTSLPRQTDQRLSALLPSGMAGASFAQPRSSAVQGMAVTRCQQSDPAAAALPLRNQSVLVRVGTKGQIERHD